MDEHLTGFGVDVHFGVQAENLDMKLYKPDRMTVNALYTP